MPNEPTHFIQSKKDRSTATVAGRGNPHINNFQLLPLKTTFAEMHKSKDGPDELIHVRTARKPNKSMSQVHLWREMVMVDDFGYTLRTRP